jgi:peptidoglycan-N-acetylglucosamine deacetylase
MSAHSSKIIVNALSLDFEEWYHPELVKSHLDGIPRTNRSGDTVRRLLDLLDKFGHRCTFFLLSGAVEAYPALVREIEQRGHELAFHGHTHRTLYEHTPESFAGEVRAFLRILSGAGVHSAPKGYRAPTFSLDGSTSWALGVLEENGFLYDSSIFPARMRLYGVNGAPLGVYRPDPADIRRGRDSGIVEFPLAVVKMGPVKVPASGGAYFRLMPYFVDKRLLRAVNRQGRPFVFYFHPWEMDAGIPRLPIGKLNAFMTYTGVNGMAAKIERLFGDFAFDRVDRVLGV